jgi:hypothetical protein
VNISAGSLKPDIFSTQLEANAAIKAANKYVSTTVAMVIMNPYEAAALMRINAIVSLIGLSAKVGTLIDTTASLNFVSNANGLLWLWFVMANGFHKDCKIDPKLTIRVACGQRISMTKVSCPPVFTIDGHEFTYLQFRALTSSLQKLGYYIGIANSL